jgi:catechol 2,3-dioxygenase-like lactoylglutathione lyase family enzyme
MLRSIDRIVLRVPQLKAAVKYYREVLGLRVLREDAHVANLRFGDEGATELVLHDDPDLPAEAVYFLVDDVRELHVRAPAGAQRAWLARGGEGSVRHGAPAHRPQCGGDG